MNDDKIIENIIKKSQMKIAVSNFNKEENDKMFKAKNILKIAATVLVVFMIGTGLAYGAGTVAEKIWKEPESYTLEVTDEEKAKCISEEEAENIVNTYLEKIGFNEQTAQSSELMKEYSSGENIWYINSESVTFTLDGETGTILSVSIPTCNYTIPQNYGIDRIEARKVAQELFEKYKTDTSENYELVKLTRNMETDEDSYIWYATFYKKYGDLLNEYESITIGWIPTINSLYSLSIKNYTYENNEEIITKDEAIQTAKEKDNEIETSKQITDITAEIQIKKMNVNVYLRENYKEEYESGTLNMTKTGENTSKTSDDAVFYKTENRVRKVWVVVVKYDNSESYSYYIDCTTGEIIGGELYDDSQKISDLLNDPYNLIEK